MNCRPHLWNLGILALLCFLCFFWRLGAIGLFDFNEGFYTQVGREMFLRGDYVTPRVNGVFFFDKPPLAIWQVALSFRLFGVSEFAARLPVALAASLLVLLIYAFGATWFGRRAGLLAACMTALTPMMLGTARQMTMDVHQSFWFAVAMICFFAGFQSAGTGSEPGDGARRVRVPAALWYHGFWAACGLSFLAKSVPGLIPIFAALVFVTVEERFRVRPILSRIRQAQPLTGTLLLLAVIVPWHYLVWRANGRIFFEEYWLHHHIQLFNGTDFNHAQPFWYYIPALAAGFFPWSLFLPFALRAALRPVPAREEAGAPEAASTARRFALVWAAVVFLLFTGMTSKLISYLLPMYAAAALLVGDWMARSIRIRQGRGLAWGATAIALSAAGALVGVCVFLRHIAGSPLAEAQRQVVPPPVVSYALHALTLVTLGSVCAAVLFWRERRRAGAVALVGTLFLFVALSVWEGLPAMERSINAPLQTLAREAGRDAARQRLPLIVHIGGPRRPSVFFYLPDSLFTGCRLPLPRADGLIPEQAELSAVDTYLAQHGPALILTDSKRADALRALLPGLILLDRHDRWELLRQP